MRIGSVVVVALGMVVGWVGRGEAERRSQVLIPQFENDAVTVWKTVLAPHEKIGMHRHEHGRVVVPLKGGTLTVPQDDGGAHRLKFETGKAYWLDADPPNQLHGDANESDRPSELMVIEMKGTAGRVD